jgi:UDPglucose 6-dehydrogenase
MAAALAKHGYQVSGIDTNSYLVEKLCEGQTTFYEPNLTEYLSTAIQNKKFVATQDYKLSSKSDVVYIAVGTPSRADGSINLSYIQEASKMIGQSLKNAQTHQLVVVKSTVLPGTARNLVKPTIEAESGKVAGRDFSICSNPEFLREGRAIRDTEFPDRIIIGSDQAAGIEKLENLYRSFHAGNLPTVIRTSFENAELIKYANNTFLAAKVSLINSIAGIAEHVPHADVKVVAEGIGLDTRIGPQFLNAGLGWGGSCWPKDLAALLYFGRNAGSDTQLINAVIDVNRKQAEKAANFAKDALGSLEDKRIAILGLAFKPDTDDLRDAVSVPVINRLLRSGAEGPTRFDGGPSALRRPR